MMQVKSIKTRVFKEKEDLVSFIFEYGKEIKENSILVIASKVVALAGGRTTLGASLLAKEKLIKQESTFAIKTKNTWWLTIKDGMVMASGGIDESNANGKLILLPKDSFKSAKYIKQKIQKIKKIKNLGVLITDSRIFPLRAGVTGAALGYAGFQGIFDYRKDKDIFGRNLKFSRTNIADSLAGAATLLMGEGNEQRPLAIITNAPVKFIKKVDKNELLIDLKDDLFEPLFKNFIKINNKKNAKRKNKK